MRFHFRKTVGVLLAFGMMLQVACASLASFTGNCPITMSVSIPRSETSQSLPCHQSQEEENSKKTTSDSNNCCEKELILSISDSIKTFDWEKLPTQIIVLDWFFPNESATQVVFENAILDDRYPNFSSPPDLLSLLQVFLI